MKEIKVAENKTLKLTNVLSVRSIRKRWPVCPWC